MQGVPQADPLPAFPGWETIEKLGEGGMCAVYRVRPLGGGGEERAIKVLQRGGRTAARHFKSEARLLERIAHPNVLRVFQLNEDVDPPWILVGLVAGRDLEEVREAHGPMEPERAARLFADVASGLAAVHALGMRHRDVKPSNIVVGHDGVPRLIDFGIALDATMDRGPKDGLLVGTAEYLAPEAFQGGSSSVGRDTEAGDVFALGQSLCEVLSGVSVHGDLEHLTGPAQIVRLMGAKESHEDLDPRDWRKAVPAGLSQIVKRATTRDPALRTPSASQFEDELRLWLEERRLAKSAPLSPSSVDPTALPPPPRTTERTPPVREIVPEARDPFPAWVGFAVAAVLAVWLGVVWAFDPGFPLERGHAAAVPVGVAGSLGTCAGAGTRGTVDLDVRIADGTGRAWVRGGTLPEPVSQCLAERLSGPWWEPGTRGRVRIELHVGE